SDIDHTGALSEAIVTLPADIKPKDSIELEVGYEGLITLDATRLLRVGVPEAIAKQTSWDHIGAAFTAVRGAGYVTWYPITTESADFSEGNSLFEVTDRWRAREAASEFHINLQIARQSDEAPPTLLCGASVSSSAEFGRNQASLAECSWKALGVITPILVVGDYRAESAGPLSLFSFQDHHAGAKTYSDALGLANAFVTDWFGRPTAPIAIADFADPHSAPFESGTLLMASMDNADTKLAGINLVHELTHSALASARPWVYEGLAHFAEAAYREQQGGREAALDLLSAHLAALADSEKDVPGGSGKDIAAPLANSFDEVYYRTKAAYVWWMLRDMIGDDAMKAAIAKYKADDDKDPKYVEGLIEAVSKRDLGWFFEDWVYRDRGLPEVKVQSAHAWADEKPGGSKRVQMITVTLENKSAVGAEMPFTVRCGGNDVTRRLEVRAKSVATVRVELPAAPSEVDVNDGSVPEADTSNNVFKVPGQ
ncbi:MAG TPA: hypothetical protein VMT67_07285, partial [Terriglobales bacterium]|nr:hypothetical protein [Terriglobales bacterium]